MLIQIFSLVLHFAVGLVTAACLLRMILHWQRVALHSQRGHPIAGYVLALSNWIVLPLRRVLPATGRLDSASLLAAYAVLLAKQSLLWLIAGAHALWVSLFIAAGFELVSLALSGLMWLVILYAIMSWIATTSEARHFLAPLIEPMLGPIRRVLPHIGGVDLSPLALVLLIQIAEIVLHRVMVLFA